MIGYAETDVFTRREVDLLRRAQLIVDHVSRDEPNVITMGFSGRLVRCHELARVVARFFGDDVTVQDGKYGIIDHTWLWLRRLTLAPGDAIPHILDVYVPGGLPQVQLIDTSAMLQPGKRYRWPFDHDIREDIVERLFHVTLENMIDGSKEIRDNEESDSEWLYRVTR